jgi:hypothetical protein
MQTLDTLLVLSGPTRYDDRERKTVGLWEGQDERYKLDSRVRITITGNYTGITDYMGDAPPAEPEAVVMQRRMIAWGIPEKRLILELEAKDTIANFTLAYPILEDIEAKNVGIVTSKYHIGRSMTIGRRICGDRFSLYPCPSERNESLGTRLKEQFITGVSLCDIRGIKSGDYAGFEEYLHTRHPFHGSNPSGIYTRSVLAQKHLNVIKQRLLPSAEPSEQYAITKQRPANQATSQVR